MATKFTQFLKDNGIDPRRVLVASRKIERLRPTDRAARLRKRVSKGAGAEASEATKAAEKPRSGRPVTPRLMAQADAGKPVTGPAKTRLLRAVNRVLEQKKKSAVDLKALF
jgi:hypothetical protein